MKIFSGWLSDRWRTRKGLAVTGYALSALAKPGFYVASTWGVIAGAPWADRVGKGIRSAPRDALIADAIGDQHRGLAFGFHRAADTAGAMLGVMIAFGVVSRLPARETVLAAATFRTVALLSLVPALLVVLSLALGARKVLMSCLPRETSRRVAKSA